MAGSRLSAPSPYELWKQALDEHPDDREAMRNRYRDLLIENLHLVPRKPGDDGNLPCGWPGNKAGQ